MASQKAMEALWNYIQTLDLSARNKNWLAERLTEPACACVAEEETEYITKEEVLARIEEGVQEMAERKRSGRKAQTLQELIDEL